MDKPDQRAEVPDPSAVRVALWRALHTRVDSPPHVIEDEIGLQLIAPDDGWRDRPDMHPEGTRGYRADCQRVTGSACACTYVRRPAA
ncbi:hypothetical protein LMG24076_01941 [Trinickia soli]|nr:hypothetical protein LMG24076_01941 [Trinickia soli]